MAQPVDTAPHDAADTPDWSAIVRDDFIAVGTAACGCMIAEHGDLDPDMDASYALDRTAPRATLHDAAACTDGHDMAHIDTPLAVFLGFTVPEGVTVVAVDRDQLADALERRSRPAPTATMAAFRAGMAEVDGLFDALRTRMTEAEYGYLLYTVGGMMDDTDAVITHLRGALAGVADRPSGMERKLRDRAAAGEADAAALFESVAARERAAVQRLVESASVAPAAGAPAAPVAAVAQVAPAAAVAPMVEVTAGDAVADEDAVADVTARALAELERASEPALLDEIFCTPELAAQREQSRLALVSPMVQLMADLSAILALIPPTVTLPPTVGQRSGFNFLHSVVGPSGAGKGGATRPSFTISYGLTSAIGSLPAVKAVGSGEVIATLFTKVTLAEDGTREVKQHTTSARLYWPEISKLAAVKTRSGATIASEICGAWSSEELGSDTKTQASFADAHCYRLTAAIGAQLATIALLFDAESSLMGLSQRLWLVSALLTEVPTEGTAAWDALIDAEVVQEPRQLRLAQFTDGDVPVDAAVRREVRELRLKAQMRDDADAALDTHVNLMRLRLAVAAAVLHGEPAAVTLRWWRWTEHLLEHHRRVRRAGQIAAGIATATGAVAAGEADALRAAARTAKLHGDALAGLRRWLQRHPAEWLPYRRIQQSTKSGTYRREHLTALLTELADSGELLQNLVDGGMHYCWVGD